MPTITNINHVTIAVTDLERSLRFYVDVLGCRPRARWNGGAYLSAGPVWLCLALGPASPSNDYSHVAFSVADDALDEVTARLDSAGARRWKDNESEGPSLYFLDPDGHKLELHCGTLESRLASADDSSYEGWQRLDAAIPAESEPGPD